MQQTHFHAAKKELLPAFSDCPVDGTLASSRPEICLAVSLTRLALKGGGMRQYVLQMLPYLVAKARCHFLIFYTPASWPSLAKILQQINSFDRKRIRCVEVTCDEEIAAYEPEIDILFCPLNGFGPRLLDRPTLATLADIQEKFFPEYFSPGTIEARRIVYPRICRSVTTLLTISEFSKQTMVHHFGIDPQKIHVTHLAPNEELFRVPAAWPSDQKPLPARYVVYPANLYPHKNHKLLLDAMCILREAYGNDLHCVLTGHDANPGIDIAREIQERHLEARVHWLGHLPGSALRYLYEHARMLVFPSQFEGFGMPLVESMRLGCPVIATNTTCIPEIVDEAAVLVESKPEELAKEILRVDSNDELRSHLIDLGRKRASQFAASKLADQTLECIDRSYQEFHASIDRPRYQPITWIIEPNPVAGDWALTLASVARQSIPEDQILVLAPESLLDARSLELAKNTESLQFCDAHNHPDWRSLIQNDIVYILRAGSELCHGAVQALIAASNRCPDREAYLGETHSIDGETQILSTWFTEDARHESLLLAQPPTGCVAFRRGLILRSKGSSQVPIDIVQVLLSTDPKWIEIIPRTFCRLPVSSQSNLPSMSKAVSLATRAMKYRKQVAPWRVLERIIRKPIHKIRRRLFPKRYS